MRIHDAQLGEGFAFFRWRSILSVKFGWMAEPLPVTVRMHMKNWKSGARSYPEELS